MTIPRPFRILVACKRVIDYAVRVRVRPDGSGVEKLNVKHSMNPFDEIALEESLRMRERLGAALVREVVAFSMGPKQCQETLRTALAMGADRAIHVEHEGETDIQPLLVAQALWQIIKREEGVGVVLLGKQAIDDDSSQTGQILAGLLGWPQATFASKVEIVPDSVPLLARVTREIEAGLETVAAPLPLVITTDLRLNEPRYATLQNIMKAKGKPIGLESLQSLGLTPDSSKLLTPTQTTEPPKRVGGTILASVDELVEKIKPL